MESWCYRVLTVLPYSRLYRAGIRIKVLSLTRHSTDGIRWGGQGVVTIARNTGEYRRVTDMDGVGWVRQGRQAMRQGGVGSADWRLPLYDRLSGQLFWIEDFPRLPDDPRSLSSLNGRLLNDNDALSVHYQSPSPCVQETTLSKRSSSQLLKVNGPLISAVVNPAGISAPF